jgi:hypothetical protein
MLRTPASYDPKYQGIPDLADRRLEYSICRPKACLIFLAIHQQI